jgi:arginase
MKQAILVPYHLDEHLADLAELLPPDVLRHVVIVEPGAGDAWSRLRPILAAASDAVRRMASDGVPLAVVSGDCTTSLAVVAGLQGAGLDPSIVWLDAHGDLHTPESSTSGYIGGMALRLILGSRPDLLADRLGLVPMDEARVVLVDARDLDPAEIDHLATARIVRTSVEALSVDLLPAGVLVLHVDLDVIAPDELPGMRYPAAGGPSRAAVLAAIDRVWASGRVVCLDIACTWGPDPRWTALRADLLRALLRRALKV